MRAPLLVALTASAGVIVAAPFVGQIRGSIQAALPGQYRTIIGGTVLLTLGLALIVAIRQITDRRRLRYGALAAAVAGGVLYAWITASGNPDVDAVERFHFVEYGLLTGLFYRVWRERGGVVAVVMPPLACFVVGVADEGLQWFIPERVGELHDVLLNTAAIACGLIFSAGVAPPPRRRVAGGPLRWGTIAAGAVLAAIACVLFIHVVHLGYDVRDPEIGAFRSRFDAAELRLQAADRAARWRERPPVQLRRLSREDQYLSEGLWHVRRRNEAASEADALVSWKENRILETFFAPVLAFPSYATPAGASWSPEQRANMAARYAADPRPYVSTANVYPIYLWSAARLWSVSAVAIGLLAAGFLLLGRGARTSRIHGPQSPSGSAGAA